MHLHILGICGTFMGGIAAIAREAGHTVTGSDANAWPPMSTQLEALGIGLMQGYAPEHLQPAPDVVVVGNVVTRGNPAMEYALDAGIPYVSGPQWLFENVLKHRHVLAVAGTHGKTTTTSLLAWILEDCGLEPGFLVGGVAGNFGVSARLGASKYFVIEADEYDTAFFDKRSKFVHYRPRTAILNNLEYDHADIFPDLAAIERQFHHLVRTVPGTGGLIVNGQDANLARVLAMGAWSPVTHFDTADGWSAATRAEGFEVFWRGASCGVAQLALPGAHNRSNALAALAAAAQVGVEPRRTVEALGRFVGVKRRLELRGSVRGVTVYDDFAHHPTAISVTIEALRERMRLKGETGRVLAVLEPRSNTMRMGSHKGELTQALVAADACFVYAPPTLKWDAGEALAGLGARLHLHAALEPLVADAVALARPGDALLVMSNGDFGGIHQRLLDGLNADG
jgi:UDP-N-acetylmuramate: L-alanyl-gamma-D-glutamyl-meso-diaminopimelate ligase